LTVWVEREDARTGQTHHDELWFTVPPDFHTHNDCVAAALMTLVGNRRAVMFNFPISARCAQLLTEFYDLAEVGPVDASLEPRRRGRRLGLNFSDGLDSMALWLLLTEQARADFRAVALAYGPPFEFEERGFRAVPTDVICRANFRELGYARHGRFNASASLLYADYLDLGSLTSGHTYNQNPSSVEHLWHGEQPAFRQHELAYQAGGLEEAHLIRGLNSLGTAKIVRTLAPELVEAAFAASAPPGAESHITKGLTLRWLYEQAGQSLPDCVRNLTFPASPSRFGSGIGAELRTLFILKHYGLDVARRVMRGIELYDLAFVNELSFDFLGKYNTNYVSLIPAELRQSILSGFHACGIQPYTERDWHELDVAIDFLLSISSNPSLREMGALRRRQAQQRLPSNDA
jgi:hypothetical protein